MVFDWSRGSTRESCVSRPPTRVAPTESDSSPRHDDESHVGGWPDSSDSSDSLDSVGGRCVTEDETRLVRLVPFAKGKTPDSCDS